MFTPSNFKFRSLLPGIALVLPLVGCAVTSDEAGALIDPSAIAKVQAMGRTLADQSAFAVSVTATQSTMGESNQRLTREIDIVINRHRKLGIHARAGSRQVYYNRRFLTVADEKLAVFANAVLPDDMDKALTTAHDVYGVAFPVADFLFSNPAEALLADVVTARSLGRTEITRRTVEHLAFSQPGIEWEIWLTSDERALPVRFSLRYLDEDGQPTKTFDFAGWDFSPGLAASDFEFTPAPGMDRIQFLNR